MWTHHRHSLPTLTTLALAAALSAGCGADTSPNVQTEVRALGAVRDMQVERDSLLAADRRYAAAAAAVNVLTGVTAQFADDVYFLAGAQPLAHGRAEALATLSRNPINATARQTWRPARVDVSEDGTRGYTYGYLTLTIPDPAGGPPQQAEGKYISFWRQDSGAWKVTAHVRNGRPAGAITESPPPGFESPTYRHYRPFVPIGVPAGVALLKGVDLLFSGAAYLFGIGEAFAHFAAPDGANLAGTPSILYGPAAIKASFDGTPATFRLTWQPLVGDVAATQDLGYTIGQFQAKDTATTDPTGYGKYLTIWKRQPGGEWRFVMDGGNSSPAP